MYVKVVCNLWSTAYLYIVTCMFALRWSHKALLTLLSTGTPVWFLPMEQISPNTSTSPLYIGPAPPFHSYTGSISWIKLPPVPCSAASSLVSTVLNDIISTMFNRKFMEELFKPQELYSKKALRTVYDRLAHASIMRLNQASMDKVSRQLPLSPRLHFLWMITDWSQMRWRTQWCPAKDRHM